MSNEIFSVTNEDGSLKTPASTFSTSKPKGSSYLLDEEAVLALEELSESNSEGAITSTVADVLDILSGVTKRARAVSPNSIGGASSVLN